MPDERFLEVLKPILSVLWADAEKDIRRATK